MALVDFVCNLCGTGNRVEPSALSREVPSCSRCGSTVRFRSIAQLLVRALTGVDQILPRLPRNRHVLGVGLSDAACYAEPLASRFGYTNTFYHQPPKLDITAVPGELAGRYYADTVEHFPDLRSRSSANDGARQLCNRTRIGRTKRRDAYPSCVAVAGCGSYPATFRVLTGLVRPAGPTLDRYRDAASACCRAPGLD